MYCIALYSYQPVLLQLQTYGVQRIRTLSDSQNSKIKFNKCLEGKHMHKEKGIDIRTIQNKLCNATTPCQLINLLHNPKFS
jgi:hypothetical protein